MAHYQTKRARVVRPARPTSRGSPATRASRDGGAKGANRTRDTALFRRVLYRLSYLGARYFERTALRVNALPCDALATMATLMGLEPTTFAVTGRRSNQLSYSAKDRQAPTRRGGHGWARTSDPPRVKRMLSR
jgi:hypothetical protein